MTQEKLVLRDVTEAEWPALSAGFVDFNYEQSLAYAPAAATRIGADLRFVVLERAGEPVAAACVRIKSVPVLGRGIAWIASGPLIHKIGQPPSSPDEVAAILHSLRQELCDKAGHVLRLRFSAVTTHCVDNLDDAAQQAGYGPAAQTAGYRTVLVDLRRDEETLLAALHGKWRGHLRKALRSEITLEQGPLATFSGRFQTLYDQVSREKEFQADIPPPFFAALPQTGLDHYVLIASKDGEDLAGITVGISGSTAVYLFGATLPVGRKLNAGYFLTWQAYDFARKHGVDWYDLGGIDAEANPMVTEFKCRAGGRELLAAGPYEARSGGPGPALIDLAESIHGHFKRRG